MNYYFDGIIVVEGTNDSSFLSSFINALFVESNGFDLKDDEIDFLVHSNKQIIILTDSDEAGKTIRRNLISKLPNAISLEVDIKLCNKNGKHGVAECNKDEVINTLKKYLSTKEICLGRIHTNDLINLGINNKQSRDYVCQKLHLGICNQKELLKRINYLNIDIKTLEGAAKEYYGN